MAIARETPDRVGEGKVAAGRDRSRLVGGTLVLLSLVYLFPLVNMLHRVGDEGSLLYAAALVADGALPYRDFFEVYGPANYYWLASFFRIFGTHVLVARLLFALTAATSAFLLYWLSARIRPGLTAALPSVFYLVVGFASWPVTSHHWDSNFFFLLALAAICNWQTDRRPTWLFAAGLLAGLVTCFMAPKGLLLVLAVAGTVWLSGGARRARARQLVLLAGAYGVIGLSVLAYFAYRGGLADLVFATAVWPLSQYHGVNVLAYGSFLGEFWSEWSAIMGGVRPAWLASIATALPMLPWLLIFVLPAGLFALGIACLAQSEKRSQLFRSATLPYWLGGLALWASELHRPDLFHLLWGSPLLLVLGIEAWTVALSHRGRTRFSGLALLCSSLLCLAVLNGLRVSGAQEQVTTRRGTLCSFAPDPALVFLHDVTKPGDPVFVYPYYPMYYFLADLENPTRFSILMYRFNSEEQFRETVAALEAATPEYVLWDTAVAGENLRRWFPGYRHPPAEELVVEPYLEAHYLQVGTAGGFRLMRRKGADLPRSSNSAETCPGDSSCSPLVGIRSESR